MLVSCVIFILLDLTCQSVQTLRGPVSLTMLQNTTHPWFVNYSNWFQMIYNVSLSPCQLSCLSNTYTGPPTQRFKDSKGPFLMTLSIAWGVLLKTKICWMLWTKRWTRTLSQLHLFLNVSSHKQRRATSSGQRRIDRKRNGVRLRQRDTERWEVERSREGGTCQAASFFPPSFLPKPAAHFGQWFSKNWFQEESARLEGEGEKNVWRL